MTVKPKNIPNTWVDPDDAPELDDEFFERATPMVGDKKVTKTEYVAAVKKRIGRPPVEIKRPTLNMRIDADILDALKASGKGWQTRVNDLLRADIKAGRLKSVNSSH